MVLLGKVKGIRESLTDTVEQLSLLSLCSTDLGVTRLYNPASLLCFIADKHQHVCLPASRPPPLLNKIKRHQFCTRDFLKLDFVFGSSVCLVPVGARQAVVVSPPGPGDMCPAPASLPLHSCLLACPDLSLIW